jgi:deoxyribodipyrimidine photo-lyase
LQGNQILGNVQSVLFHPKDIPFFYRVDSNVLHNLEIKKRSKVREEFENALPSKTGRKLQLKSRLEKLGFDAFIPDPSAFPFLGGENQALKRLKNYFWETKN